MNVSGITSERLKDFTFDVFREDGEQRAYVLQDGLSAIARRGTRTGGRVVTPAEAEIKLRAELKPLLDLAERAQGLCDSEGFEVAGELAAELQGWRED